LKVENSCIKPILNVKISTTNCVLKLPIWVIIKKYPSKKLPNVKNTPNLVGLFGRDRCRVTILKNLELDEQKDSRENSYFLGNCEINFICSVGETRKPIFVHLRICLIEIGTFDTRSRKQTTLGP
jgi:hypothetical protein